MAFGPRGVLLVCLVTALALSYLPDARAGCGDEGDGCNVGSCCGGASPGGTCWGACFGGCPGLSGCATDAANENLFSGIATGVGFLGALVGLGRRKLAEKPLLRSRSLHQWNSKQHGNKPGLHWQHDTMQAPTSSIFPDDLVQIGNDVCGTWSTLVAATTSDRRDGKRMDKPMRIYSAEQCSLPGPACEYVWPELEKNFKDSTFVLAQHGLCTYTGTGGTYKSLPYKVKGCPFSVDLWVVKKDSIGTMQCMSAPHDDKVAPPAPSWCYTCDPVHKCREEPGGLVITTQGRK